MAQTTLGIDIGSYSVKAVLLESTLKRQTVKACREYHLTNRASVLPDPEELREVARSIAADSALKAGVVILGLPGIAALKKWLSFPFDDQKKIDEIIGFPFGELVPIPFHELVIDHQVVRRRDDGQYDLLALGVRKEVLGPVLEVFRDEGLDPKVVTSGGLALMNLQHRILGEELTGCHVFLNLGYHASEIVVIQDGVPLLYHTVLSGTKRIADALAASLDVPEVEAQEILLKQGEIVPAGQDAPGDTGRAQRVIREETDALLAEVFPVLHGFGAKHEIEPSRVFLTGGVAALEGSVERAELAFSRPVQVLMPQELDWGDTVPPGGGRASCVPALALAFTPTTATDAVDVDFRKGEYAYQGAYEYLKGKVGLLATFLFVFMLLLGYKTWTDYELVTEEYETMVGDLEKLTGRYLGKEVDDFDTAFRMLQKSQGPELASLVPGEDMFDVFVRITDVMDRMNHRTPAELGMAPDIPEEDEEEPKPKSEEDEEEGDEEDEDEEEEEEERVYVELYDIQLDRKQVRIRAETNSVDAMEYFLAQLRGVRCLHHVLLENSDRISFRRHMGWRRFTMGATYECKASDAKAEQDGKDKPEGGDKPDGKAKGKDADKGKGDGKGKGKGDGAPKDKKKGKKKGEGKDRASGEDDAPGSRAREGGAP
jgi:general secretion pathway protein L